VEIELIAGERSYRLRVVDDGVGFDASRPRRRAAHYGLATMRERAEAVGARLRIHSRPGRGTRVEIELPRGTA
jgi:signal transduction histidine kinase